uniref:Uncharacterized protein n=1 Tax=Tanacetum cinerariifolium TaxID=118510 RepID=A0A6L2KR84_TANCI|nr:hypothetical protein [Tanacetum cinerariifolium]
MAESSSQNPSSPNLIPKEEPVTLDKPESPNPFLPAIQVEFTSEETAFTTNNKVALIYFSHPNQEYFKDVFDFISKCCLKKAFIRAPNQYKEYLSEFWYTAKVLPESKIWVSTPTGEVRGDIGITTFRNALRELAFTDHMKAICNLDVLVNSKAPKYSSSTEEFPQGKKPEARSGFRRKQSSKHTSESTTEASKSQTSHLKRETKSSSAIDTIPSHPSPPTPVGLPVKKEPTISSVVISQLKLILEYLLLRIPYLNNKLEDLSNILKDTRSAFFTPDSPTNKPIIVSNESEEEKNVEKDKDTGDTSVPPHSSLKSAQIQELMAQSQKEKLEQQKTKAEEEVASLKARPSYPDINQLTELLVTSLKPKLSKLLASHDFASRLPIELKELPSKFTKLSGDIKELNQHIRDMEIELPEDLKEIPTNWNLSLPLSPALPPRFTTMMENSSGATTKDVPLVVQETASSAEGEKNTNPATTDAEPNLHDEIVDLLG